MNQNVMDYRKIAEYNNNTDHYFKDNYNLSIIFLN